MKELEYSDLEETEENTFDLEGTEEPTFTWQDLEQNIYVLNDTMAQLAAINTEAIAKISQQQQMIEKIHGELVAQGNVVAENFKQSSKLSETLSKSPPDNVIGERIQQLQDGIRGLLKTQNQNIKAPILPTSLPFSSRSRDVAMLFVFQTIFVAIATTVALNLFPPPATVKNEQQWYAIFQRVDKLYKTRHGSK